MSEEILKSSYFETKDDITKENVFDMYELMIEFEAQRWIDGDLIHYWTNAEDIVRDHIRELVGDTKIEWLDSVFKQPKRGYPNVYYDNFGEEGKK